MTGEPTAHTPDAILARMEQELRSAGDLGLREWSRISEEAAVAAEGAAPSRIIVTGCGDSYYAGLVMRYAFEDATGVPVLAMPAMDVATLPQRALDDALLIGVSVSGKVGRTIDAVRRHAEAGGRTVAVTSNRDSDIGHASDRTVATGLRGTPGPMPGTVNYLGSLLGLLGIANGFCSIRGRDPLAPTSEVERALSLVDTIVADRDGNAERLASHISEPFFSVGSGPDFGTANLGVAKFLEAAATVGVAQDLEEWAHEQFFATGPGRTVIVHATRPEVRERAASVCAMADRVGGTPVLISTSDDATAASSVEGWHLPQLPEAVASLATWAPLATTALNFARAKSRWPFGLDREGRMETVDSTIYVAAPRTA